MGEGFNFKKLREGITALSSAKDWDHARREWRLHHVYDADDPETCLCGHHPIIEVCVLHNQVNSKRTEVGNVCVHKFMKLASKKVFDCLRRIRHDIEKAANVETIDLFYERGVLDDWQKKFALDTCRKRQLSKRQMEKRVAINRKILANTRRVRVS